LPDQAAFCFDPRVIDWTHYVREVHLPSVVQHARVKTTPGKSRTENRSTRLRAAVLSPERHLAAFDLENTLIASNVVASYSWLATRRLPRDDRLRFVLQALEAPRCCARPSATAATSCATSPPLTRCRRPARGRRDRDVQPPAAGKSFPAGIRRVREHRRLGHRTC
jgi:hypothetical protein